MLITFTPFLSTFVTYHLQQVNMSVALSQSDPPVNQWKELHRRQSLGCRRKESLDSHRSSMDTDFLRASLTSSLIRYDRSIPAQIPRMELLLKKRNSPDRNSGDCSIPRTVSTSSSLTDSDDDTILSLSTHRDSCDENQSEREHTLAMDAWDAVAVEYSKRVEPFTSQFLPFLLNRNFLVESSQDHGDDLHYLRGKRVLDVATGTGAAALYAVSKGAKVTATDFSTEMLKIAETRAYQISHNCSNMPGSFESKLADGENLSVEWTNRYDVTCSNFGVIYFPDLDQGLQEMVRCTKPGGKVCISAWGRKEMTNAFRIFPAAIRDCGFEDKWPAQKSEKPNFFLPTRRISATKKVLHNLLEDAGLSDVKVIGPFPREMRLSSAEDYWYRFVLGCPNVKRVVEHFFTDEERSKLKESVIRLVKEEAHTSNVLSQTKSTLHSHQGNHVSLTSLSTTKIINVAAKSQVAIADSGATHHLWPDYSAFVSYKEISNKFVSLADGTRAPIKGIGDIAVSLGGRRILIRNVYYVPSLNAPLYSLGSHRRLPGCGFFGTNDSFQITFPKFSLTIADDADSYMEYSPIGKTTMNSFDYIEPRQESSITSKNGCIVLNASAYIAFGSK